MHGGGAPQVKRKAAERLLADKLCVEFGLSRAKDPDRIIAEVACIAFTQTSELFDENGNTLPVHLLPPHVQAAIASQESVTGNVDKGDGQSDRLTRIKLWDKPKALEMLGKHHGLFVERSEVTIKGDIEARLKGGRGRADGLPG